MIGSRLELFRQVAHRHGLRAALARFSSQAAKRWATLEVGRLLWLEAARITRLPPVRSAFRFCFLTPEEIRRFAADPINDLHVAIADRLLGSHDLCFAALCGTQLAAYGWFALGSVEPEHCGGVALSFPTDVAYTYKGFTRPEFRGLGLYGQITAQGFRALDHRGISNLLASVEWTNWASLKSCYRLGYADLGLFVGLGRGGWRIVLPPKAAQRRGVRFGKHAMPRSAE
jgi:hypothetical protein